jgi:hypothetical protein
MSTDDSQPNRRQFMLVGGGVAAAVLGYGYWRMVLRPNPNSADIPDGTFWICNSCNDHFNLSVKELSDHHRDHYGEPVACPKCKATNTVRANRCRKCREFYPMARGEQPACPKCGTKPAEPT